jgi:hypothetical protein
MVRPALLIVGLSLGEINVLTKRKLSKQLVSNFPDS